MSVFRWVFHDPSTAESYQVPINPNQMSDPQNRQRVMTYSNYDRNGRFRTFETPAQIVEWSFGGVMHTEEHYKALEFWSKKSTTVQITDHLGRTWAVVMKSFEPVEVRPTALKPWRFTYTMKAVVLRRLA